jgi:galactokinase
MAVDRRTFVAAAARSDRRVRVRAFDVDDEGIFDLDQPRIPPAQKWMAYIAGVAIELEQRGFSLTGAELGILSAVPIGAGLSSSAALEVSVGKSLLALAGRDLDLKQLALVAQLAEHNYAGTKCGIMDQLTVAGAREGHALLIDCRSLQLTHIPLNLPDVAIVVCNTNVKHDLASSAYNERRSECERGEIS